MPRPFPWARFRQRQGAVKLPTRLDWRAHTPVVTQITGGKIHDVNVLDPLISGNRSPI
ncbi:MAG: hypothetical protein ACE15F_12195 [bacterium]